MSKARSIRTGLVDSYACEEMPDDLWRFFVLLMLRADDLGLFYGDPRRIASACYPTGRQTADDCKTFVEQLLNMGLIISYQDEKGRPYIYIRGFKQSFQRMRRTHPKPPDAVWKECLEHLRDKRRSEVEQDTDHPKTDVKQVLNKCLTGAKQKVTEVNRSEVNRIEGKGVKKPSTTAAHKSIFEGIKDSGAYGGNTEYYADLIKIKGCERVEEAAFVMLCRDYPDADMGKVLKELFMNQSGKEPISGPIQMLRKYLSTADLKQQKTAAKKLKNDGSFVDSSTGEIVTPPKIITKTKPGFWPMPGSEEESS